MLFYWFYTTIWILILLVIALIPNVPFGLRMTLAAILAIGTPAGGQFTTYRDYLEWRKKHVIDPPDEQTGLTEPNSADRPANAE